MGSRAYNWLISHRLSILAALAAIGYNNWLLGPFLNSNLSHHNGSISEYSVASQPHHWLFQSLDIISGCLLILLGWVLWQKLRTSRKGLILAVTVLVLGLANLFDASFALPCSETLNRGCQIPVNLSLSNYSVPSHAYSSVVIGVCYLFLPLAAAMFAYHQKLKLMLAASLLLIADDLFSLASVLEDYVKNGGPTTRTSGSGQEIQMLLLGGWLVISVFAIAGLRVHKAVNKIKPVANKAIPR